ncbi:MAG: hypothetical protein ICV87_11000 [Gemmatimonadetes bacterium]|nr:hypothetical protein [Gemmatimonadota bacterium]
MSATLVVLALATVAVTWHFARLRGRAQALTQPLTSLAQYRNSLAAGDRSRAEWMDCPICGCATIDCLAPASACPICDWEYSPAAPEAALEEARARFTRHGSVNTPQEMRGWGGVVPDAEVLAATRAAVDVCRQAGDGVIPFGEALHLLAQQQNLVRGADDALRR